MQERISISSYECFSFQLSLKQNLQLVYHIKQSTKQEKLSTYIYHIYIVTEWNSN